MQIHKQIKHERLQREWTKQNLADKAGVSAPTIASIEGGAEIASIKTLKKIARALGKQLDINIY
jgi:transcriptional regulator with XRE-family HTH domain